MFSLCDLGADMKTMIVIRSGMLYVPRVRKSMDLFSGEEIDRLDVQMLSGLSREELLALKQKCLDSFDWLDSGDCDIDSPEMREWERLMARLNGIIDLIDDILDTDGENI